MNKGYFDIGFANLNQIINGLNKGSLVIVSGKTNEDTRSFAYSLMTNMTKDKKILFFELDEDKERVRKRIAKISGASIADTITIIENICEGNLFTDDWTYHLSDMITECRHHKKKFGDLDVVVINNLQEMSIHGYKKITEDRKEIARALKSLAKELDCSIVLISNLDDYDIVSAADVILKSHREDCYRAIKCINKIAKIEIVFENVEFVTIPADNIVKFSNDIMHRSIQLELDERRGDKTAFDRILSYNDIVWIEVLCNDGKTYRVDVPWRNSTVGGEENALQKTWIKDNGNLCLSIVEEKDE